MWLTDPLMNDSDEGRNDQGKNTTKIPFVTFSSGIKSITTKRDKRIKDDQIYNIVVTDWLASGGDGFGPFLKNVEVTNTNISLQEALLYYTLKKPVIHKDLRLVDAETEEHASLLSSVSALFGSLTASICSYPLYTMSVLRATSAPQKTQGSLRNGIYLAAFASAFSNSVFFFFLACTSFRSSLARSIFAATINVILTNPMWVIVTRMQTTANIKSSCLSTAKSILYKEGPLGFLDGMSMNMIMIIYPTIRHLGLDTLHSLGKEFESVHLTEGIFALLASCFAAIVTYPIQRWRLQLQARQSCETSGLFRGVQLKILHSGLTNFILFATMSQSEELIDYMLTE